MLLKRIKIDTLHLQKKTKFYSYYPINNIVHMNTQSKNIHHTLHLHDIPLDANFTISSPALNITIGILTTLPPHTHICTHTRTPHTDKNFNENTSHNTSWSTAIQVSRIPKNRYYLSNISQIIVYIILYITLTLSKKDILHNQLNCFVTSEAWLW